MGFSYSREEIRNYVLTPTREFASAHDLQESLRHVTDLKATIELVPDESNEYLVGVQFAETLRGLRHLPDWKVSLPNTLSPSGE